MEDASVMFCYQFGWKDAQQPHKGQNKGEPVEARVNGDAEEGADKGEQGAGHKFTEDIGEDE